MYYKDIGLVVCTYCGQIKIFDAFKFHLLWHNANKHRKQEQHTTITCIDISQKVCLMATGGAEGKLLIVDPYAFGIVNSTNVSSSELVNVWIYSQQKQVIAVSKDRTITVYDIYRLTVLQ